MITNEKLQNTINILEGRSEQQLKQIKLQLNEKIESIKPQNIISTVVKNIIPKGSEMSLSSNSFVNMALGILNQNKAGILSIIAQKGLKMLVKKWAK